MIRTYVVDNGECYSDHNITFVETEATPEQLEELVELRKRLSYDKYTFVAAYTEGQFVWREGVSSSLREWLYSALWSTHRLVLENPEAYARLVQLVDEIEAFETQGAK